MRWRGAKRGAGLLGGVLLAAATLVALAAKPLRPQGPTDPSGSTQPAESGSSTSPTATGPAGSTRAPSGRSSSPLVNTNQSLRSLVVQFSEQTVPADRPDRWPSGRWVPVTADQYERLKRALEPSPEAPPRVWLRRADYTGRFDPQHDRLQGELVWRLSEWASSGLASKPRLVSLEPLRLQVSDLQWADGTSALWGAAPDGQTSLLLSGRSSSLRGRWQLPGRKVLDQTEFSVTLPPATVSTLTLHVPAGFVVESSDGVVVPPRRRAERSQSGRAKAGASGSARPSAGRSVASKNGSAAASGGGVGRNERPGSGAKSSDPAGSNASVTWVVYLGGRTSCRLTVRRADAAGASTPVVLYEQSTAHTVRQSEVETDATFTLQFERAAPPRLTFSVPTDLKVTAVTYDRGLPLEWTERPVKGNLRRLVQVRVPEGWTGRRHTVRLRGFKLLSRLGQFALPPVALQTRAVFLAGRVTVSVEPPLRLRSFRGQGLRQSQPLWESDSVQHLALSQFVPGATLTLSVGVPATELSADALGFVELGPEQWTLTAQVRWRCRAGSTFRVACQLPPGWEVTQVRPSGGRSQNELTDWSVQHKEGGLLLVLRFRNSLRPSRPQDVVVEARRLPATSGSAVHLPAPIPLDCETFRSALVLAYPASAKAPQVSEEADLEPVELDELATTWSDTTVWRLVTQADQDQTKRLLALAAAQPVNVGVFSFGPPTEVGAAGVSSELSETGRQQTSRQAESAGENPQARAGVSGPAGRRQQPTAGNAAEATDQPTAGDSGKAPGQPASSATNARRQGGTSKGRAGKAATAAAARVVPSGPTSAGGPAGSRGTDEQSEAGPGGSPERTAGLDNTRPLLAEMLLTTTYPSAGEAGLRGQASAVHEAVVRLIGGCRQRLWFELPPDCRLLRVTANGVAVPVRTAGRRVTVPPLKDQTLRWLVVRYASPCRLEPLGVRLRVPVPQLNVPCVGFQWQVVLPREYRVGTLPAGLCRTEPEPPVAWTVRLFGPLGRRSDEPGFNPLRWDSWKRVWQILSGQGSPFPALDTDPVLGSGVQQADDASRLERPSAVPSLDERDPLRSARTWRTTFRASRMFPAGAFEVRCWNTRRVQALAWMALWFAALLAWWLRNVEWSYKKQLAMVWLTVVLAACAASPPAWASVPGACLAGTVLSLLVPIRRRKAGDDATETRSFDTGKAVALASLLVLLVLADALGQPPSGRLDGRQLGSSAAGQRPLVVPVLLPSPVERSNGPAFVYLPSDLYPKLLRWVEAKERQEDYLLTDAHYKLQVDADGFATLTARLHLVLPTSKPATDVWLPLEGVNLGAEACRVDGRLVEPRPGPEGRGFVVSVRVPAPKPQASEAGDTAEKTASGGKTSGAASSSAERSAARPQPSGKPPTGKSSAEEPAKVEPLPAERPSRQQPPSKSSPSSLKPSGTKGTSTEGASVKPSNVKPPNVAESNRQEASGRARAGRPAGGKASPAEWTSESRSAEERSGSEPLHEKSVGEASPAAKRFGEKPSPVEPLGGPSSNAKPRREAAGAAKAADTPVRQAVVELTLFPPVRASGQSRVIDVRLPAVPRTSLELEFPAEAVDVQLTVGEAGAARTLPRPSGAVALGKVDWLRVAWKPGPLKTTKRRQPKADVTGVVEVHPAYLSYDYKVVYHATDEVTEVVWRLPAGACVGEKAVQADGLLGHRVEATADGTRLHAVFASPQSGDFTVRAQWILPVPRGEAGRAVVPVPAVVEGFEGASSQWLALVPASGFRLELDSSANQPATVAVAAQAFEQRWGEALTGRQGQLLMRLDAPASLATRLLPQTPQHVVRADQVLHVHRNRVEWTLFAEVENSGGPVFRYHLRIDPRLRIRSVVVKEDDAERLIHWARPSRDRLVLFLRDAAGEVQYVTVKGEWFVPRGTAVPLPSVEFVDGERRAGTLLVYRDPDVGVAWEEPRPALLEENPPEQGRSSPGLFEGKFAWGTAARPRLRVFPIRARLQVEVFTLLVPQSKGWDVTSWLRCRSAASLPRRLKLVLPGKAKWKLSRLDGSPLEFQAAGQRDGRPEYAVKLPADAGDDFVVVVRGRLTRLRAASVAASSDGGRAARARTFEEPRVPEAVTVRSLLAVARPSGANGQNQPTAVHLWQPENAGRVGADELPDWVRRLVETGSEKSDRLAVFRGVGGRWRLVRVRPLQELGRPRVALAVSHLWLERDGTCHGQTRLFVVAAGKELVVDLPPGTTLHAVSAGDQIVATPEKTTGRVRVPLNGPTDVVDLLWTNRVRASRWLPRWLVRLPQTAELRTVRHVVSVMTANGAAAVPGSWKHLSGRGVAQVEVVEGVWEFLEARLTAGQTVGPALWELLEQAVLVWQLQPRWPWQTERFRLLDRRVEAIAERAEKARQQAASSSSSVGGTGGEKPAAGARPAPEPGLRTTQPWLTLARHCLQCSLEPGGPVSELRLWLLPAALLRLLVAGAATGVAFFGLCLVVRTGLWTFLAARPALSLAALGVVWWSGLTGGFFGFALTVGAAGWFVVQTRRTGQGPRQNVVPVEPSGSQHETASGTSTV